MKDDPGRGIQITAFDSKQLALTPQQKPNKCVDNKIDRINIGLHYYCMHAFLCSLFFSIIQNKEKMARMNIRCCKPSFLCRCCGHNKSLVCIQKQILENHDADADEV